jgi:hypothetical protein
MYRISLEKLLALLVKKAEKMSRNGLPASMEEKFVKTALEIPIMNIKREDSTISMVREDSSLSLLSEPDQDSQQSIVQVESQSSTTSSNLDSQTTNESQCTIATSVSISTPSESPSGALTTPPEVPRLLRIRTGLNYILSSYIPSNLRGLLHTLLSTPSTSSSLLPDFQPLTTHLSAIAKLRSEVLALRSISDNISRKRGYEEDEEKIAEREEKKRKKEEEDQKKKTESRGIKQLKKVDTSGMKKLSSFFAPKAGSKK